jgi:hypothetical protein
VLRNGINIATTFSPAYNDASVSPSTTYVYTVEAFDVANLVSEPSNALAVTTPAPSPPQITNVAAVSVTAGSAVIQWTTDIPSSSQVSYGLTAGYGSTTTLDLALVTAHSQTLTGLSAGTMYHFDVTSASGANLSSTSADQTFVTLTLNVTLPDLQMQVPPNLISIATVNGQRQLQYTHIIWDAGTGPFEIDPSYNSATGAASFTQAIYSSPSPGVWNYAYSVPVSAPGSFVPLEHKYNFPMGLFTLNSVNPDGSPGATIATSPKTDYCITGDVYIGGVPNTPNATFIPQNHCSDPTLSLGWSVGWGDQYDQMDPGQPISLVGVLDGTYILHSVADPEHVLLESNRTNNVIDTLLQISGSTVTVLSQTHPIIEPPTVSLTSPADSANVSGSVVLQASASAAAPATITSVQFLLDGYPLGGPVTTAPYAFSWTIGSASPGKHLVSARATDSNGNMATAAAVGVTVVSSVTPTSTPTFTITPNGTNTSTLTASPTSTSTAVPTATNTLPPTTTNTPPATSTPSASATGASTPTATGAAPTATATSTTPCRRRRAHPCRRRRIHPCRPRPILLHRRRQARRPPCRRIPSQRRAPRSTPRRRQ